jgi:hypothetical protein
MTGLKNRMVGPKLAETALREIAELLGCCHEAPTRICEDLDFADHRCEANLLLMGDLFADRWRRETGTGTEGKPKPGRLDRVEAGGTAILSRR